MTGIGFCKNNIFSYNILKQTSAGQEIINNKYYNDLLIKGNILINKQLEKFRERFVHDINNFISSYDDIYPIFNEFIHYMDKDLAKIISIQYKDFSFENLDEIKNSLSVNSQLLLYNINRIFNSNFIITTHPILEILLNGAIKHYSANSNININDKDKFELIYVHILALSLAEQLDRIMDKDEDLESLSYYKFIAPFTFKVIINKINKLNILSSAVEAFSKACKGQYKDYVLQNSDILSENDIEECYDGKYGAVIGAAGKHMALYIERKLSLCNNELLSDLFMAGMSAAAKSMGCGNEMEDYYKNNNASLWIRYYNQETNNIKIAITKTFERSNSYLVEAYKIYRKLDDIDTFPAYEKHFIQFMFLIIKHYNEYWYNRLINNLR
ncbi:MAG: hypothetical protein KatS3mg003_0728 [Candidatus Nitrosocaldaceae archaeon]|nr:MAG: hypothetical protein KatS3mg003_0728 [Candidatus Nitrosocaldaceae archaeon]